jgi:large subunit ribosomal protein L16
MLLPKRTKFRKSFKMAPSGLASRGYEIAHGSFGLKAMDSVRITARQIEAARIAMTRSLKREGQVWIRIFPDMPVTQKPQEVRMGKGKGAPEYWAVWVHPGRILFEVEGVPKAAAEEALRLAAQKLPITCKFIVRRDYEGN